MFFQFNSLSQEVIGSEIGKKKVRYPSVFSIRSYLWVIVAIHVYIVRLLQLVWKKNNTKELGVVFSKEHVVTSLLKCLYRARRNTTNKNEKMKLKAKICSTLCNQQDNFDLSNSRLLMVYFSLQRKIKGSFYLSHPRSEESILGGRG